jgi:hypothetical protein
MQNKIRVITLWNTCLIFHCRNESVSSDEVGVRVLLGNNTWGLAVMLRPVICVSDGVPISTRISCIKYTVGYIYTQFLFAQNSICTQPSGTKLFHNSGSGCAVVLTKPERHCCVLSHLSCFDRNITISIGYSSKRTKQCDSTVGTL